MIQYFIACFFHSFQTLINPMAINNAIGREENRRGQFPNPWQRQQQQRQRNVGRGKALGNKIRGIKSVQSVQHRGGGGGG